VGEGLLWQDGDTGRVSLRGLGIALSSPQIECLPEL
jgi:hypothetical protein